MQSFGGAARFALGIGTALVLGCGSGGSDTASSGGGSSSNGSSSGGSSGASSSSGGLPSPLVGTWDVISAVGGRQRTATVTVTPTSLVLEWQGFSMNADVSNGAPSITASFEGVSSDVTATHIEEAADYGQIPYRLAGSWNFGGRQSDQCTATVKADSAKIDCSNLAAPLSDVLQGYDYVARKPLGTGTSTAQRKSKRDSIFGELGGEWAVVTPRASCSVTFEGNKMTADCDQKRDFAVARKGIMTLTFEDGIVSGTSNAGELSARRR